MAELKATSGAILGLKDATGEAMTPMQALISKTVELGAANTNAKESAAAFTSGLATEREAFDRLRASVDPAFAAQLRYTQAVNEARIAEQLGVASKEETAAVLAQLSARFDEETAAAARASGSHLAVANSANRMGYQVQNAAFQVQDFAVQVAAGTSVTRALGQQLPQLLGSFGIWPAVIGAAIAVLIPLGSALLGTGKAADSAEKDLQSLENALAEYTKFADLSGQSTEALREKFGRFAEEMRADAQWMAQIDVAKASAAFGKVASDLDSQFLSFNQTFVDLVTAQKNYDQAVKNGANTQSEAMIQQAGNIALLKAQADEAAKATGLTADQILVVDNALNSMRGAKTMAEIADRSQAALDAIRAMFPAGEMVPEAIQGIVDKLGEVHSQAAVAVATTEKIGAAASKTAGYLKDALDVMKALANSQPSNTWLDSAISQAETLYQKLFSVADLAQRTHLTAWGEMVDRGKLNSNAGGRGFPANGGYVPPPASNSGPIDLQNLINLNTNVPSSSTDGGGGGSPLSPTVIDLQKLVAMNPDLKTMTDEFGSMSDAISGGIGDALTGLVGGTQSVTDAFSSMTNSILSDISKIVAQNFVQQFISPLINSGLGATGFFPPTVASANGNIFAGGNVIPFAKGGIPGLSSYRNQIVQGPTMFAMGGLGVMGEAGPEAIMPLKRGPGGVLGVQGGGSNVQVNIVNKSGGEVTQRQSTQGNSRIIDITIEASRSMILDDIARGGPISDALGQSFGARRQGR